MDTSYNRYLASLDAAVPIAIDSEGTLLNEMARLGLSPPLSIVLRGLRAEAILSGTQAYNLLPLLAHQ